MATLFPLGCGEGLPPLAPVKGTVTVDGKKLTSGQVALIPETTDATKKVPPSSGKIEADGTYEIFTGGKSGAPLAKYKVVVTPDMSKGMESKGEVPYDKIYLDPSKTKLGFEVVASPDATRYDLKLTK